MRKDVFLLSIETTHGHSFVDQFHLGTDVDIARDLAAERFNGRIANRMPTVTVALLRSGRLVDCYDGRWSSEAEALLFDDPTWKGSRHHY